MIYHCLLKEENNKTKDIHKIYTVIIIIIIVLKTSQRSPTSGEKVH